MFMKSYNFQFGIFFMNILFCSILNSWIKISNLNLLLHFMMMMIIMIIFKNWFHFMALIILFEFFGVTVLPMILNFLMHHQINFIVLFIMVIFIVVESCINLSILVKLSRFWGSETTQMIF